MLRGQVSLLTGDRTPDRLRALAGRSAGLYSLSDHRAGEPASSSFCSATAAVAGSDPEHENPEIPASRCAAIVFTSGSTGEPVAHPKTWGVLAERSADAATRLGVTASRTISIVGMVPPNHMYGFETTVLLPLHTQITAWCGAAFIRRMWPPPCEPSRSRAC